MKEPWEETIFEEREELMVSPFGGKPTLRVAHFLRPSISIDDQPLPMLSSPSFPVIPTTASDLKESASRVEFKSWRRPQKMWEAWLQSLRPKYQSVWKKAGIYEAIMGSKYIFFEHKELVLGLAEKWCPETNTFMFLWGEATITLEDMMILGGFSVLGESVSCPFHTKDLVNTQNKLIEARKTVRLINGHIVTHVSWLNHFIGSGNELEHLAFLSLWLSKFLFPSTTSYILERRVFPIAIHLARGTRIALAPAVLSRIYEDLGLLKLRLMDCSTRLEKDDEVLNLFAPFQLVQLWAWERFPLLRSTPNPISNGEPRLARWHRLKPVMIENIRASLDSAGECFQWRPYAIAVENWLFPKFYQDKEQWVLVDSCLDKELESFARCLRVCKLVGLDCMQQYFPHRVAMQFGMDQDIPACVPQHYQNAKIEWNKYNRMIGDAKIYLPPRLMESDVTTQYLQLWRKQSMLAQKDPIWCFARKPRNSARVPRRHLGNREDYHVTVLPGFAPKCRKIEVKASCGDREDYHHVSVPPGFAPKCHKIEVKASCGNREDYHHISVPPGFAPKCRKIEVKACCENREDYHHKSVPPGFAPKCHKIEVKASYGGAENSVLGALGKPNNEENRPRFDIKSLPGPQCQNLSHLESVAACKIELLDSPAPENMMQGNGSIGKPQKSDAIVNEEGHLKNIIVSNKDNNEKSSVEMHDLELEARISRLEGEVARVKALVQRLKCELDC